MNDGTWDMLTLPTVGLRIYPEAIEDLNMEGIPYVRPGPAASYLSSYVGQHGGRNVADTVARKTDVRVAAQAPDRGI